MWSILTSVSNGTLWDSNKKLIGRYDSIDYVIYNYICFGKKNNMYALINLKKEVLTECIFENIYQLNKNYIITKINKRLGLVNTDFIKVIPNLFDYIDITNNEDLITVKINGKFDYIRKDSLGKWNQHFEISQKKIENIFSNEQKIEPLSNIKILTVKEINYSRKQDIKPNPILSIISKVLVFVAIYSFIGFCLTNSTLSKDIAIFPVIFIICLSLLLLIYYLNKSND